MTERRTGTGGWHASRDHHEHGGASTHPDDDELAHRAERERVDAGLDAYDPDDIPPAEDGTPVPDPRGTDQVQEERAEIRHEVDEDEIYPLNSSRPFPPTRYDRT